MEKEILMAVHFLIQFVFLGKENMLLSLRSYDRDLGVLGCLSHKDDSFNSRSS